MVLSIFQEKYGTGVEFNPLMRELFSVQGRVEFIVFKVIAAALLLSVPLLLYKRGTMQWTKAFFLSVFAVSGAVAAIAALQIGEIMDSTQEKMFRISDESWERLKLEIGYPG